MTTDQTPAPSHPWAPIRKPAEIVETRLMDAILNGSFPVNSHLPAERELAASLGVTRPTLREALQRLERDGWVEIHQGKSTRVRDYWQEGRLGVLSALADHPDSIPDSFVQHLLTVRLSMAPTFTRLAIEQTPEEVVQFLAGCTRLDDSPGPFAEFDWQLQHRLAVLSGNPVFVMILNGFTDLYAYLAPIYFSLPAARERSRQYYEELASAAKQHNPDLAQKLTEDIMRESLSFWEQTHLLK